MSAASMILAEAERLGVVLVVRGDKLCYSSPIRMPLRLLTQLKTHKPELLRALRQRQISTAASPRPVFEYRLAASPSLQLIYLGRAGDTVSTVRFCLAAAGHTVVDVRPWTTRPPVASLKGDPKNGNR